MTGRRVLGQISGNAKRSNPSGEDGLRPSKHPRTQEMASGSTEPRFSDWSHQVPQNSNYFGLDNHRNFANGTWENPNQGETFGFTDWPNSDLNLPINTERQLLSGPQMTPILYGMPMQVPPGPEAYQGFMPYQPIPQLGGFVGLDQGFAWNMAHQHNTYQGVSAFGQLQGNQQEGHATPLPATSVTNGPLQQPMGLDLGPYNADQLAPTDPEIPAPLAYLPDQTSPVPPGPYNYNQLAPTDPETPAPLASLSDQTSPVRPPTPQQQQPQPPPQQQELTPNPPEAIGQAPEQEQHDTVQLPLALGQQDTVEEATPVDTTTVASSSPTPDTGLQDDESKRLEHAWLKFVGTRDLTRLFQGQGSLAEREKYAKYFDHTLKKMRDVFEKSVDAGLRKLLAILDEDFEPVEDPIEGPVVEDLDAIISRIRARRQESSFEGYFPACTLSRLLEASVDSMRIMGQALPTELDFTEIKYGRAQKVQGKGGPGCVAGEFEIVKGGDHRPYAGHRGGDFVFRYVGKQTLDRDSFQRFSYSGQVPRTADEYEWRLDCIKEDVNNIMRAVLNFKLYWDARTKGHRRPDFDIPQGTSVNETLKFYRDSKRELPELDHKESVFKTKMTDWLCGSNVICEFGWLMDKRMRTGWKNIPADIMALSEMVTDSTMKHIYILANVYDARQEKVALKMLLEERAAGNEVVVCLHNVYRDLFPVPTDKKTVSDAFRSICAVPDLSVLVETALATREEEIVRETPYSVDPNDLLQDPISGNIPSSDELGAIRAWLELERSKHLTNEKDT